jgi:hypothetical protein
MCGCDISTWLGVQVLSESTGEPIEVLCGLFATGLIATTIALLALKKEKKQQITTKKNQIHIQAFRISYLKLQSSKVTSGKKPCSFLARAKVVVVTCQSHIIIKY